MFLPQTIDVREQLSCFQLCDRAIHHGPSILKQQPQVKNSLEIDKK